MARADKPDKRYAVTCRHVLDPDLSLTNRETNQDFEFEKAARPPVPVLMPGDATYENLVKDEAPRLVSNAEMMLEVSQRQAGAKDDQARNFREWDIERRKDIAQQATEFRDVFLPSQKDKETRTLGNIAWAPPLHRAENAGDDNFVLDVCVVEVDLDSFGGEVPENAINCAGHFLDLMNAMNPKKGGSTGSSSTTTTTFGLGLSPCPRARFRILPRMPWTARTV